MTDPHVIARRWLALWNGGMSLLDTLGRGTAVTHAAMIGQVTETPMTGRDALGCWIAGMQATMPMLRFAVEVGRWSTAT